MNLLGLFVSLLIYLFFPHILYPDHSFSFLLSSQALHSLPNSQTHYSSISVQKMAGTPQGYQPNMEYHVEKRLGTSPHINAEQGIPIRGKASLKQVKESKVVLDFTVRNQTRTTSCTTLTYIQRTNI